MNRSERPPPTGMNDEPPPPEGTSPRQTAVQHQASLLRYAYSLLHDPATAQDVVQDTFLRLARADPPPPPEHLAAWLFTVCRNRARDHWRKEGRMTSLDRAEFPPPRADEPTPAAATERGEQTALALRLANRLPPLQREVVRLKFQGGLSYQEIAAVTGKTVSHVGVILHGALQTLRSELAAANALPSTKGFRHEG